MDVAEPLEPAEQSGDFVQSLARGLAVIRAFDAAHPQLSVSDVARRTEMTRAAARRFLLTLEALGYVRSAGRDFALTPKVLELGHSYLAALSLPEVLQPHLEALSRLLGESTSAAVLDGADIVYITRVPTRRIMTVGITIGTRFPAFATSMGRVLLAGVAPGELQALLSAGPLSRLTEHTTIDPAAVARSVADAGADGWSLVDQELEEGLVAAAVPVRGRDGAVVAAINVATSRSRVTPDQVRRTMIPALVRAAAGIDADLRLL